MKEERRVRNTSPECCRLPPLRGAKGTPSPSFFWPLKTDSGGQRHVTEKGGGSGEFISPDLCA